MNDNKGTKGIKFTMFSYFLSCKIRPKSDEFTAVTCFLGKGALMFSFMCRTLPSLTICNCNPGFFPKVQHGKATRPTPYPFVYHFNRNFLLLTPNSTAFTYLYNWPIIMNKLPKYSCHFHAVSNN